MYDTLSCRPLATQLSRGISVLVLLIKEEYLLYERDGTTIIEMMSVNFKKSDDLFLGIKY